MKEFPFDPGDEATLDRLRRMPVFEAADPAQLPSLLGVARLRSYEEEEVIIAEGDTDQTVYFLIRGRCSVNVDGMDLGFIDSLGDVFGEMGMVDRKPRSATITAVSPTLCLALDGAFLDRVSGTDKLAAEALFYRVFSEILAARIRDANARILILEDELEDLSVQRPTF